MGCWFFFLKIRQQHLNYVCISDCFCNVLTTAALFNRVYPKLWEPSTYAFIGVTLQQWIVSNGLYFCFFNRTCLFGCSWG